MDWIKEAFIEGYKQRAEASNLIFDNASRMYAIALFGKWKREQLILSGVGQQRELLKAFQEHYQSGNMDDERTFDWNIDKFLKTFNCD